MSTFSLPDSYGPYIDTHVPSVINTYSTNCDVLAGEIDEWDEAVSLSIHNAHAYANTFFRELMDKVNTGVSQLNADIAEVKRLKTKRWNDASNSFNWAGVRGPGFGWDSFTNGLEGIWNNDKAREDHANAAVREGGYDAEIARLNGIKSNLDTKVRPKVQTAIDKANEVLDLANEMPRQVLRLAELNAGYVWTAFRLGAYKDALIEFRSSAGQADMGQMLNFDNINRNLDQIKVKIVDGEVVLAEPDDPDAMTMSQAAAVLHEESLTPSDIEGNDKISDENLIPDRTNVGAPAPVASPVSTQTGPEYHPNTETLIEYTFGGVDDQIWTEYQSFLSAYPNGEQDFGSYMMTRYDSGTLSPEITRATATYIAGQNARYPNSPTDAASYFNIWKSLLIASA